MIHFLENHLKEMGGDFARNLNNLGNPGFLKRKIFQSFCLRRSVPKIREKRKSVSPGRGKLPSTKTSLKRA